MLNDDSFCRNYFIHNRQVITLYYLLLSIKNCRVHSKASVPYPMSDFNGRTNRPFLHIDDDLDFDLNEIVTPESKTAEMTRKRKNINLGDPIPRKSIVAKGPLDEAQERQRSFLNNMKQPQPFLRPTTSRGRMHEKSNNIFPAFRAQCTNHLKVRSTPANRGDENDDHAQDLVAFTVKQRAEANFVDLYQHEDTYSRDSPIITERMSQPWERDDDAGASFQDNMARSTHAHQASSTFSATSFENNANTSSPEVCRSKKSICLSLDDDGSQNVSSVLDNISHEPYISKPRAPANRSFLPGLTAVNAPTRKRPVVVKTSKSTADPKPSSGPQRAFTLSKANAKPRKWIATHNFTGFSSKVIAHIYRRFTERPKGSGITPGACFASVTGSKSRIKPPCSIECADPYEDDPLEDTDDEFRGNGAKKTAQTRGYKESIRMNHSSSSRNKNRAKNELISIEGSDDEIEVKPEKKVRFHRCITTLHRCLSCTADTT